MATFDFSTLYTKIPPEKLLNMMNEICDFCFQGGSHIVLSVSTSVANLTHYILDLWFRNLSPDF